MVTGTLVDSWHSYPSIYALGHRAVADLLTGPVNVEEKVDGSQFSWCVDESGEIRCRSKGATLNVDAPEKMFSAAVATVKSLSGLLTPGWTYRAEFLGKPKHNALAYDRMPKAHLILFDVNDGHESYLSYAAKHGEAERLGLECVPLIFSGRLTLADFRALLDRTSILGGQKIEGVVVKPSAYDKFGADKKVLLAKFVSEAFKEVHAASWKQSNPTKSDVIERLRAVYNTPGRWSKAVQHLRERGLLEDSPRDIGKLIGEVQADVERECSDEIREKLFAWAWPQIQRGITSGLPAWYKEELVKMQFSNEVAA